MAKSRKITEADFKYGEMWNAFGNRYGWSLMSCDSIQGHATFKLASGDPFRCPVEVLDDIQRVHAESNVTSFGPAPMDDFSIIDASKPPSHTNPPSD